MNFLEALKTATQVIREQRGLDEVYLYDRVSQKSVYLKNREGVLEFDLDRYLKQQIYLGSFLDKQLQGTSLSIDTIFSISWEVHLRKTEHLRAELKTLGKTKEQFIDYTPAGKEDKEEEQK